MGAILLALDPTSVPGEQLEAIKALAPDKPVIVTRDRQEMEAVLDSVEIVAGGLPRDLLERAPNLRWLQQWGAGVDWLMRSPEAREKDFILTNASGVHAIPISEHILAFMFAFARGLHHSIRSQTKHDWQGSKGVPVRELAGSTMVLIGVGAIGGRTAEVAAALGMRVLGVRRDPSVPAPGVEAMYGPDQLLSILPEGDFVVLTVPLTYETKGMIGERELRAMKDTAIIINIGRGGTIQADALVRALREGWIGGAGLDVTDPEPLPEDSPLWDMENVIITPHNSGSTPKYEERAMAIFLDNLRRYVAGEPLRNVVDKQLGY
ncbi:MAG: D-2-hydroxyacid dehydrogenase [Anaerolineae bacterium]|jgi:phosphoglycerate dehydrogenase-like enzyme